MSKTNGHNGHNGHNGDEGPQWPFEPRRIDKPSNDKGEKKPGCLRRLLGGAAVFAGSVGGVVELYQAVKR